MEDIIQSLKGFVCENILSDDVEVTPDTVLKDIGVDSFSVVEIVLFIERKYGKLIPDHLMVPDTFVTIRSMAKVVEQL